MFRYALKIEYHGKSFAGWQRQKDRPSVQQSVEDALRKLDASVEKIAAAGRTDAGVHAWGQVAHVDLTREWDAFRLMEAVNFHLKPAPIAIVAAAHVPDEWHARYAAIERRYIYRVVVRRAPLTHEASLVWRVGYDLDVQAMQTAADYLVGHHDFTTFRSTMCQSKSPLKTIDRLNITEHARHDGVEVRFDVRARSFLHNQVRSFVGTLERVGMGAWKPEQVKEALEARDRTLCGPVCMPDGLYLAHVIYPEDVFKP